jgi:hypothetical protein
MSLKYKLGVKLMSLGAKMCLNSDEDKEKFKDAININTTIGSYADSGDHLRGAISPMNDYDTQSVVNVLKQNLLIEKQLAFNGCKVTDKSSYYSEKWR